MKINFDFNPNSLKENDKKDFIFNHREVIIMNRKYKCKTFLSQEDADEYLDLHPNLEILSLDSEGINIIPSDYYGVEVVFTPYEFKRYEIQNIEEVKKVEKKHSKVTWISEESTIKRDTKRKS